MQAAPWIRRKQITRPQRRKEMLAVVYLFYKFRSYLIGAKTIVYTTMQPSAIFLLNKMPSQDLFGGYFSCKSSMLKFGIEEAARMLLQTILNNLNFDFLKEGKDRMINMNMLGEFRNEAFENSSIYKERMRIYHDRTIEKRAFVPVEAVLLYNAIKKSKWLGPFTIKKVMPSGTMELLGDDGRNFMVNGHHVKRFYSSEQENEVFVLSLV